MYRTYIYHHHLPYLIDVLTGSSPNNFLSSIIYIFLSLFQIKTNIHPIVLISFLSNFILCFTFIGQVLLPLIKQLLAHLVYTLPFSFSENLFPIKTGKYARF